MKNRNYITNDYKSLLFSNGLTLLLSSLLWLLLDCYDIQ